MTLNKFKAACNPIGGETWILREALTEKLDIFAKTCYRIMPNINNKFHINFYQTRMRSKLQRYCGE